MLVENFINANGDVSEIRKVEKAIQRLKSFEPNDGYWLAFSGGKDSVVLKALADMACVKYEAHYSLTTLDPPELVQFIKTFSDVSIDRPDRSMWQLIVDKSFPPTRTIRYCCDYLKETKGRGRVVLTGVRWAESARRRKNRHLVDIGKMSSKGHYGDDNVEARRMVEQCYRKSTTTVNPIIDWEDEDVWEFINQYKIPYCSLYDEGFKRLGCIGCPLSGNQEKEFNRWPTYKKAYMTAFQKMIDKNNLLGKPMTAYSTAQEAMDWYMGKIASEDNWEMDGQIDFEEIS